MAPPIKQLQAGPDIILLRLDGLGVEVVAQRLNTTPSRVSLWSRRFETCGLEGLADRSFSGDRARPPSACAIAAVPTSSCCGSTVSASRSSRSD
jgi:Helix-turn-helix domain